jgi:inositol-phosphate phosphatase/L-galactose 1-phosphate phosphatase/histidinol-phosphatase
MNKIITQEIIDFANQLADISSEIIKKYFRCHPSKIEQVMKDDNSPVTIADKEVERAIRNAIIAKFPDHGIIGEEEDDINLDSNYQWIIDPIDGTSSFIIGRPTFGTLIALSYKGKSMLGIMNQPINGERWVGVNQPGFIQGSWLNNNKIITSDQNHLSEAILCTTSPFFFQNQDREIFNKLTKTTKYQQYGGVVYGGDCYSYALLATGFVDIVLDPGLKIYDYAALIPIIEMAGGIVTDWSGNEVRLESNFKMLACANKKIHQQVLRQLSIEAAQ